MTILLVVWILVRLKVQKDYVYTVSLPIKQGSRFLKTFPVTMTDNEMQLMRWLLIEGDNNVNVIIMIKQCHINNKLLIKYNNVIIIKKIKIYNISTT